MVIVTESENNRACRVSLAVSAHLIGELSVFQRTGWAVYLLELLDDGQEGYEQVLTDVIENIRTRLEKGEW